VTSVQDSLLPVDDERAAEAELPGKRPYAEIQRIVERLMPEETDRAWKLRLFVESICLADRIAPRKWNVSVTDAYIMLKIGHIAMNYNTRDGFGIVYDPKIYRPQNYDPTGTTRRPGEPYKAVLRDQAWVYLLTCPSDDERRVILAAKQATMESANRSFDPSPAYITKFHQPALLAYLRRHVDPSLPDPAGLEPTIPTDSRPTTPSPMNITTLQTQLQRQGLSFTSEQIATYITALQVKGFVILSGMSGTGKTKLAQGFAELLPKGRVATAVQRPPSDKYVPMVVKPYMLRDKYLILPAEIHHIFDILIDRKKYDIPIRFHDNGQEQTQICSIVRSAERNATLILYLRGRVRNWLDQVAVNDIFFLHAEVDEHNNPVMIELCSPHVDTAAATVVSTTTPADNLLFIPVRPDWRDSKSLLGYYNPLTRRYVPTEFLRFVTAAAASYRRGEPSAWFIVLDEMNLARVEHYFADLLSVLESGRDDNGWTKETLRFGLQDDGEDDLPEPLNLPPNLYIIGTVNMDETTHAFSPKVLDRAFTLEFNHVDFSTYGRQANREVATFSDAERHQLLLDFRGNGRQDPKTLIHAFLDDNDWVRTELQQLNHALQPSNLHFGYRVFDEIVLFLVRATQNGLFAGDGDQRHAFDAAVLMKVLPKFHGSRARLEKPLYALLAWCLNPDKPDPARISETLRKATPDTLGEAPTYRYRRTAARVQRMLEQLRTDGFASFG
jgi:5-methylcytosine-specific restriction endonuclease McrBC GTP-binding regulatory subunit McrB